MNTHSATSTTVRPQPRQTSSKVVEQTATQGVSGRSADIGTVQKKDSGPLRAAWDIVLSEALDLYHVITQCAALDRAGMHPD